VISLANQFCTVVTVDYVPRALVLYRSLVETCPGACLRVVCMDTRAERLLNDLALPGLVPIAIRDVESTDPMLVKVKPGRTKAEYALTVKPSVCLHAFQREPQLEGITYLDADLMFFADFALLLGEMTNRSILLIPHRYPPQHEWMNDRWGVYNAGTVSFARDRVAVAALDWWRERCLDWCFSEPAGGRWTDQRYLDDWLERFEGVKVLEHPGGGLAPWNATRYSLSSTDSGISVSGYPLVFYHYHGLVLYRHLTILRRFGLFAHNYEFLAGRNPWVWNVSGVHTISEREAKLLWIPYLYRLRAAAEELQRVEPQVSINSRSGITDYLCRIRRTAKLRSRVKRAKRSLHITRSAGR
jgi:hypothetical protein